ncbi:DUF4148 domain-containing protein [Burkholderia pseudomultivorans]|uniref:Purine nucleoside phosphorylase n=1 Tax=Burkholderia pseudomultivorans TaxID=1207504 RepID=A0A132ECW1_9BURK|nr:DUF4148 domain-containing protein [Burkholderia pseudomultivorans]KWF25140.1 hypothetical protein WT56_22805 [Burkholderia pseudomultivorans]
MNTSRLIAASMAVVSFAGFATHASAQALTRAEVRQALIEAEDQGSRFVTDTSYPAVSPLFEGAAAETRRDQANSGVGGYAGSASDAGKPAVKPAVPASGACVGPASYCSVYFGS